ncbi:MAG: hypothetical protein R3362_08395, partial [Rhodothermales bacterium]|nr:hypothetical protein [Rhodothermales bacterium]
GRRLWLEYRGKLTDRREARRAAARSSAPAGGRVTEEAVRRMEAYLEEALDETTLEELRAAVADAEARYEERVLEMARALLRRLE